MKELYSVALVFQSVANPSQLSLATCLAYADSADEARGKLIEETFASEELKGYQLCGSGTVENVSEFINNTKKKQP